MRTKPLIAALFVSRAIAQGTSAQICEKVEDDPNKTQDDELFQFSQSDDRLDPNKFVRVVYKILSEFKGGPVKKVTLDYNPKVRKTIGKYGMKTTVTTTNKDGVAEEKCYEIIINVIDTDECTFNGAPQWMHACDPSTTCVNTIGDYFCACKEGEFVVPGSGRANSRTELSSNELCSADDGSCRADFKCHADSCARHDCHAKAACSAGAGPNEYTCACETGFEDVSPAGQAGKACQAIDRCSGNPCPTGCGCVSVTNATTDGYTCPPKAGFVVFSAPGFQGPEDRFRLDPALHLCVDENKRPTLKVVGESPLLLPQGSVYVEQGVVIEDENQGDLKRTFTTDYSEALGLRGRQEQYVTTCGWNFVTYSIETPWSPGNPSITQKRAVEIVDVDECTYTGNAPQFKHTCTGLSTCRNLNQCQGYECICEQAGYEPDGAQGCRDARPPVLACASSSPGCASVEVTTVVQRFAWTGAGQVFEDEAEGDSWVEAKLANVTDPELTAYDLRAVPGAPDVKVDLIDKVHKGPLVKVGPEIWSREFSVEDGAGNVAVLEIKYLVTTLTPAMIQTFRPAQGAAGEARSTNAVTSPKGTPSSTGTAGTAGTAGAESTPNVVDKRSARFAVYVVSVFFVGIAVGKWF